MSECGDPVDTRNPFAASRVRPGALGYHFPQGHGAAELVRRLQAAQWRGEIVGPHGSGKSTLLATLAPAIQRAGRPTLCAALHDGQRRLPWDRRQLDRVAPGTVLIVDGYEQLSRFSRFRLKRLCRRRKLGLLATAHSSVGLPELFRTRTEVALAQALVEQLQSRHCMHVTPEDVSARFARCGGNLRELLFDLYDLYERRRRGL